MKKILSFIVAVALAIPAFATINITESDGWFEAAYCEWTPVTGATGYTVSYKQASESQWTAIDAELVRNMGSYYRADVVGLAAGSYQLKVEAQGVTDEATTAALTVRAHDRHGFAHYNRTEGVGAYNNDGTLKTNARVLYVTAANAKTVTLDMQVDSKGTMSTRTGLQDIIQAYEKGQEKRPLAIRILGCIKAANMDSFGSSAEGLQVKGNGGSKCKANLTIEGIGNDATIHGFGILCRSISSVEFRNFAIMICMDDCLSLDTDNKNVWIHNMDFFYGGTGGDADQAKGDGTVDIKGKSSHVTVSYNHFYDSGKCSLGGMKSETTDCWMTYHHNWFDHSDSRHPRIRTAYYHVYNNYYDGNSKYGVGVTTGGSSFVESNYFRNCKYPMLSSKQGTDAEGDGTFSGENGGVIKAYNNTIIHARQVLYYTAGQTNGRWDAVQVSSRDEAVTATALVGGTSYNSTADAQARLAVPESAIDPVANVKAIVKADAGRLQHGNFIWKFDNSVEDENYGVISDLKSALVSYNGTAVQGGSGIGLDEATNDAYVPIWGGADGPEDADFEEEPYIASVDGLDYFFFGENAEQTNTYITNGVITLAPAADATKVSTFNATYTNTTYKKDAQGNPTTEVQCQTEHTGSLQLGQSSAAGTYNGGSVVFYCPNGVTSFKLYTYRTGSSYYKVYKSTDGVNYTEKGEVNKGATGILEKDFTSQYRDRESTDPVWIKVVNGSTGGLNIQGVVINKLTAGSVKAECDLVVTSETDLTIAKDATSQIVATATEAISYSSANNNVATVSATGLITAVGYGTTTITVSVPANDSLKAGRATISVTVPDPRTESTMALTSAATVSVKEGETAQITVTGAAGTVTYASSAEAIATVSATGLISAIKAGSAVITITDPGTENVKAKSITVTVNVTKDMTGIEICSFTVNNKVVIPSSTMVVVTGNAKTGASLTYNGVTYTEGVKMESATAINITPSGDCTITLVFDAASTRFKLDGVTLTSDAEGKYTFTATGGTTYVLTKGDSMNLYLVIFDAGNTGGGGNTGGNTGNDPVNNVIFDYVAGIGTVACSGTAENTTSAGKYDTNTTTPAKALKFANSFASTDQTTQVTTFNYVTITPAEGFTFQAGDTVKVIGYFNNSDDTKQAAIAFYTEATAEATAVLTTDNFVNGRTVAGVPAELSYVLETAAEQLLVARSGNTATYVMSLKVIRPADATALETIRVEKVSKAMINGRLVIIRGNKMFDLNGMLVK